MASNINFKGVSGYMGLDSWILANIIEDLNTTYCKRFLNKSNDPCGRQYDQMTQAARSVRANIAEGSMRNATSRETEMRLIDVAKSSLGELASDYLTQLRWLRQAPWPQDHPNKKAIRAIQLDPPAYSNDVVRESQLHILSQLPKFEKWVATTDMSTAANAMLILCGRELTMILGMLGQRLEDFKQEGGFAENLTKARLEHQAAQNPDAPRCPECGGPMIERTIKRGTRQGQSFWGCANYPRCTGTREK